MSLKLTFLRSKKVAQVVQIGGREGVVSPRELCLNSTFCILIILPRGSITLLKRSFGNNFQVFAIVHFLALNSFRLLVISKVDFTCYILGQ